MMDPELLLLDEITSALDPLLVGEVLDMVEELKAQADAIGCMNKEHIAKHILENYFS
jgi:ABC-type polar amino acid transport system ATPase subunit